MKHYFLILSLFVVFNAEAASLKNTLNNHASPYLAMHGDDPVAWQEWNKETVARAKKEGKLIYVSSGYFSCHWCHVMQRESYKNNIVAKILNENFIPVKVDREINSALDSRLIDFVERTQGRAGWPLNVFITPEGYPLVGMIYVPTKNFIAILNNLKSKWQLEKKELQKIARSATNELATPTKKVSKDIKKELGEKYLQGFLLQAEIMSDDMSGGFGQQNKFPSYPQLAAMLKMYEYQADKISKQFLILTLEKMASQGLNDQLAGGFFRYTVDPNWQTPHFEKMLYDNALLASLYIDAARIFKNEKFAKVAKNTLNFMHEVLRSKQGAHIASLSAVDNKGIEGGYYLWQRDELNNVLNRDEFKLVELIWQLEGNEDLEGGHHLVEVMNLVDAAIMLKIPLEKAQNDFNSAKDKMLRLRNKRGIPRDDKLLGGWNGLALSAYAKAAKQFNDQKYAKAAKEIKNYIYNNLWKNKILFRAVKNGKVIGVGEFEDYAYVVQGLYDWLAIENNKQDKDWLDALVQQSWHRFKTPKGWLLAENMLLKYGQGEEVILDGVLPSASAVLVKISLKLAKNDKVLMDNSLKALNATESSVMELPFWHASHIINVLENEQKQD